MLHPKPFLTYFLICAVPLLLLAALNYWNGTRSVDTTVNAIVQDDLNSFTAAVDQILSEQESVILKLAVNPDVQRVAGDPSLRSSVNSTLKSVLELREHFHSLALFDRHRQPLWFGTKTRHWNSWDSGIDSTTLATLPQPDERVWTLQGNVFVDPQIRENEGLAYSVPIHDQNGLGNEGALVAVVDLRAVCATVARRLEAKADRANPAAPAAIVRDRAGKVVYQSQGFNEALQGASSPLPRLHVAVIVARSKAPFISSARRWGVVGFAAALFLALIAAFLLDRHGRMRSRGIARVREDLSAIAKGELDRRIVLKSTDDARGLADNINVMTERMRAQIAREEESRQFDSFVRLSAMLTHDLKNAIESLSLTVNNMERHFDNPQFRADALKGLTSATDKLKSIVARLSRPVSSLSGEHKRPANVDIVPILKRVTARIAHPLRNQHTIEMNLPATLFALADAARIEEVIENLMLNALEAMGDKSGTLRIEAGTGANGASWFSISDTGAGMSRAFIENHLFRPFATTKKNGIGLGLYTCREVIRASAGSIEVESVEGAGTTFRVVLPSISHDRRN